MPLTPDQERWAEALQIEKMHGDRASVFIVEQIGTLARVGDAAGVSRFREIAARLDQLFRGGSAARSTPKH